MEDQKIVILGAGFTGVRTALDLASFHLPANVKITLIDKNSSHCFIPELYETAGVNLLTENKTDFKRLESVVYIPLNKIFSGKKVEILTTEVTGIDLSKKIVFLSDGQKIAYDFLVIGLGSETNYCGIDGAIEYGHPFKTGNDALNIRNGIDELVYRSSYPISIAIVGGGFTGVELAGKLAVFLQKLAFKHQRGIGTITLFEAANSLLPGMPAWAQQHALKRLEQLGVNVVTGKPIDHVQEGKIICQGEYTVEYDYLIWTTGVRGLLLEKGIKGIELNKKQQIIIARDLSLKDFPECFVGGDIAEIWDKQKDIPFPATAWAAIAQGKLIAKNIRQRLSGNKTIAFTPNNVGFVVPIGEGFAVSNVGNLKIHGLPGWILKKLIVLQYLTSILPFWAGVLFWIKGVRIYNIE